MATMTKDSSSAFRLLENSTLQDAELLDRFLEQRDERAFEMLIDRHGSMVMNVCRRILQDSHESEDVYQATFLLLAHRGDSIRKKSSVASWLHGVAYRLAQQSKRQAHKENDLKPPHLQEQSPLLDQLSWREGLQILDRELLRLPEKYRLPLVLCYLGGRTRDEAASLLGSSVQQIKGRLERGREKLRHTLTRLGVSLPSVVSMTLLCQPAPVKASCSTSALSRLGMRVLAGCSPTSVGVRQSVVSLVEHGLAVVGGRAFATAGTWIVLLMGVSAWVCYGASVQHTPQCPERPKTDAVSNFVATPVPTENDSDWKHVQTFATDPSAIEELVFSSDGKRLLLPKWRARRTLLGWETASWKPLRTRPLLGPTLAFDKKGELLCVRGGGRGFLPGGMPRVKLTVLREKTAKVVLETEEFEGGSWSTPVLSSKGDRLAFGIGTTTYLYDVTKGKVLGKRKDLRLALEQSRMAFSPDGSILAVAWGMMGDPLGEVTLFDGSTLEVREEIRTNRFAILSLAFSPDGRTLAGGGNATAGVFLWDTKTGKRRVTLSRKSQTRRLASMVFSKDCKYLFTNTAAENEDGERDHGVVIWDLTARRALATLTGLRGEVNVIAISPDGRFLAAGDSKGVVRIWQKVRRVGQQRPRGIGFEQAPLAGSSAREREIVRSQLLESGKVPHDARFARENPGEAIIEVDRAQLVLQLQSLPPANSYRITATIVEPKNIPLKKGQTIESHYATMQSEKPHWIPGTRYRAKIGWTEKGYSIHELAPLK